MTTIPSASAYGSRLVTERPMVEVWPTNTRRAVTGAELPLRRSDVLAEVLDNDLVLYDPTSRQAYLLNGTASAVWQLCDGTHSIQALAQVLADTYGQPSDRLTAELEQILARFRSASLLEP